jgi:hypothetical protein
MSSCLYLAFTVYISQIITTVQDRDQLDLMYSILIFLYDGDRAKIAFSQDLTAPLYSLMSSPHLGVKQISENLEGDIKINNSCFRYRLMFSGCLP